MNKSLPPSCRIVAALLLAASTAAYGWAAEPPHWIAPPTGGSSPARLQRTFELQPGARQATLKLAADFCTATVELNGARILQVEPYSPTQTIDVLAFVRRGTNAIRLELDGGVAQPSAAALSLEVEHSDGQRTSIVSDAAWADTAGRQAADHGAVRPELWGLGRRDASVSPLENYEQWRQAKAGEHDPTQKFFAPPGFEVRLLRQAKAEEGSWIALAFDPQGRAVVSREDHGFLRFSFDDDRRVTKTEAIESDLKECRGLLFAHGRLYANANNSKGLYSLNIDDAGRVVEQKLLREFPGEVGHGRNDLALDAEGRIVAIMGDSVQQPTENIVDRTSPLRESRDLIARGEKPRKEAFVVRTDADGRSWELLCTGLRNPYGLAVHPNGDLFTYDADNEFDMGTPWYRPTRIVQLVSGADYGYRAAIDKRRPNFVDRPSNAQPTIDVGRGSPTAAMFGTQLKFPPPYREAMFALDWTYGRVLAVHLAPRGTGYRAALETFLQGRPLNVTDVAAGPDGAMYLITGGRKTQSALYRVAYSGSTVEQRRVSDHERTCADYSASLRSLCGQVEALHGKEPSAATNGLLGKLRRLSDPSDDPGLAYAFQIADECKLTNVIRCGSEGRFIERCNAVMPGMAISFLYQRLDEFEDFRQQDPELVKDHRPQLQRRLRAILDQLATDGRQVCRYGDDRELRRRIVLFLAKLDAPTVIEMATPLLESSIQEDRLAALSALSTIEDGWTIESRRAFFAALNDGSRFVGGQGMPGFLDQIREDAVATLSADEKRELADVISPPKPVDEPLPPKRSLVKKWKLAELSSLVAGGTNSGNAERGALIFRDALCARCHRAGLNGPAVGPDLTFVARRFSRADILQSILAPSASVADQYRNSEIETTGGHVLTGRVVAEGDYRSEKLLINVDPLRPSQVKEINKKDIAAHRLLPTSPMPEGLLDTFTADDIRDLLAYLEKGGG